MLLCVREVSWCWSKCKLVLKLVRLTVRLDWAGLGTRGEPHLFHLLLERRDFFCLLCVAHCLRVCTALSDMQRRSLH